MGPLWPTQRRCFCPLSLPPPPPWLLTPPLPRRQTVELKPDWAKGYSRLGAALFGLGKLEEVRDRRQKGSPGGWPALLATQHSRPLSLRSVQAAAGYQRGLDLEPGNESLKSGLAEVQSAQARAADSTGAAGIGNLFTHPDAMGKIATHPSTAAYLQQPDFVSMLTEVQRTPGSFNKYMSDPRMMQVLGVLLGVDIHTRGADDHDTASTGGRQQQVAPKARQPEPVPEVEMTGAPAVCRLGWPVLPH